MIIQSLAIILAYYVDLIVGDPRNWPHPVKFFGRYISFCERYFNKGRFKKFAGLVSLAVLIIIVFFTTFYLLIYLYRLSFFLGLFTEAVLIATTMSQKGLKQAALAVHKPLKQSDLSQTEKNLSEIVGRDTNQLSEPEMVRATVETVAENTTDGITAPLFWAFIGGAPLALVYRAINTCDSVVGYKTEELQSFGWASARVDDLVNWIPARITGGLMLLTKQPYNKSYRETFKVLLKNAKKHNSPNSGWNEAAVAAILGVQLGGMNTYQGVISKAPLLGNALRALEVDDIIRTIEIMKRVTVLFIVGGVLIVLAFTWF